MYKNMLFLIGYFFFFILLPITTEDFMKMQELLHDEDISEENIKKYLTNYSCFITCTLEKSRIVSVSFILFSLVVIFHFQIRAKSHFFFQIQNDEIQLDKLVEMANNNNISLDEKKLSECIDEGEFSNKRKFFLCLSCRGKQLFSNYDGMF